MYLQGCTLVGKVLEKQGAPNKGVAGPYIQVQVVYSKCAVNTALHELDTAVEYV